MTVRQKHRGHEAGAEAARFLEVFASLEIEVAKMRTQLRRLELGGNDPVVTHARERTRSTLALLLGAADDVREQAAARGFVVRGISTARDEQLAETATDAPMPDTNPASWMAEWPARADVGGSWCQRLGDDSPSRWRSPLGILFPMASRVIDERV